MRGEKWNRASSAESERATVFPFMENTSLWRSPPRHHKTPPSRQRLLSINPINLCRQFEIQLRKTTLAMSRQLQEHFVPSDIDIRMVILRLRQRAHLIHKSQRLREILKLKLTLEFAALNLPGRQFGDFPSNFLRRKKSSHRNTVHHFATPPTLDEKWTQPSRRTPHQKTRQKTTKHSQKR